MEGKEMKVVVFSFDKYSWLIPTFLHFYKKNWPDNPYQTILVTETIKAEGINTFCAGKIAWADRAIEYLNSLKDERFILFLEEYILNETVDTNRVKWAESLCAGDVGCVRLYAHDRLSRFLVDIEIAGFREYPLDVPYSVSMQSSVWQREFFLKILKSGENAWQSETEGSKRVHKFKKKVIWSDDSIINYHPGGYMKKGRVVKSVERWVEENW